MAYLFVLDEKLIKILLPILETQRSRISKLTATKTDKMSPKTPAQENNYT